MNFPCIFFGTLFSIAGILFASGRIHPHLSAWKQMSEEEKEQINIVPLCRNIGNMIFLSGMIFLFNGFLPAFQKHLFTWTMIAWMVAAGLDLLFISKSRKFKKQ